MRLCTALLIGLIYSGLAQAQYLSPHRRAPTDSLSSDPRALALEKSQSGGALLNAGRAVCVGGLAMTVFGYFPAVRGAGIGAFFAGVPLIGLGSGMQIGAAQGLDPDYRAGSRGWAWGLALGGAGLGAVSLIGIHDAFNSTGQSMGEAFTPFFLLAAAMGMEIAPLIRFQVQGHRASRAVKKTAGPRVSLEPALDSPGQPQGMRLTYRF